MRLIDLCSIPKSKLVWLINPVHSRYGSIVFRMFSIFSLVKVHSSSACLILSILLSLQSVQIGLWTIFHFARFELVFTILCINLEWKANNLVSCVEYLAYLKVWSCSGHVLRKTLCCECSPHTLFKFFSSHIEFTNDIVNFEVYVQDLLTVCKFLSSLICFFANLMENYLYLINSHFW